MTSVRDLARLQAEQQADVERVVAEGEPLSPYATECLRHKRGDRQHADLGHLQKIRKAASLLGLI